MFAHELNLAHPQVLAAPQQLEALGDAPVPSYFAFGDSDPHDKLVLVRRRQGVPKGSGIGMGSQGR